MNTDEIVRALRQAANAKTEVSLTAVIMYYAADLIESLTTQLAESQRREKALIADIHICCETCAHKGNAKKCPGGKCSFQSHEYWQWRGVGEGEKQDG